VRTVALCLALGCGATPAPAPAPPSSGATRRTVTRPDAPETPATSAPAPATPAPATSAPAPTAIRVPGEVALHVGEAGSEPGRSLAIELLSLDGARATIRIVVAHGDHEVDLTAGGPPVDVDGVRVRFVRAAHGGSGAVLSVDDDGGRGWSPRER
jgi:hypothetical protein